MKNEYSITVCYDHFFRYYNFNTNKFDLEVTKLQTNKNHFCSDYSKVVNIQRNLNLIEQKKPYPQARNIYLRTYKNKNTKK